MQCTLSIIQSIYYYLSECGLQITCGNFIFITCIKKFLLFIAIRAKNDPSLGNTFQTLSDLFQVFPELHGIWPITTMATAWNLADFCPFIHLHSIPTLPILSHKSSSQNRVLLHLLSPSLTTFTPTLLSFSDGLVSYFCL